MKILLIEDNEILVRNTVRFFSLKNIHIDTSLNGEEGFYKAKTNFYDAIILDISLTEMDGLEVCEKLRNSGKNTPIIMLTSRSSKQDIIKGLDKGADDYLTKPFDYDELLARIKSLTRRNLKNKSNIIKIENYILDLEKQQFLIDNKEIKLSSLEFKLITYFFQNRQKVISKRELYEKVWGEFDGDIMFSKTVEVYIGYLRKKINKDLIKTKKASGYFID